MPEGHVNAHIEHGINTIEFFHPQSNSLPGKILDALAREIHFAGTHDDTRVIILKSAGEKIFCSGASFDELAAIKTALNFQAESGVVGRLQECSPDWCRIGVDGNRGWLRKSALWGVEPGEVVQ